MFRSVCFLMFLISWITSGFAQEQKIAAKARVIEFSAPYEKIKLEFFDEAYRGFSELKVDSTTIFLTKKGKKTGPESMNVGAEVEAEIIRKGYSTRLLSVKFISKQAEAPAKAGDQPKPKYATESFTGASTFAVGRGLGSNLGRDIDYDATSPSWGVYIDRRQKIKVLGYDLTPNKYAFFTLGAFVGWKTYERSSDIFGFDKTGNLSTFEAYQRWRYWVIGGRTTIHMLAFRPWKRWDPYIGFMLSYNFLSYSDNSGNSPLVALPTQGGKNPNFNYFNPAKSNGKLTFYAGSRYYLFRRLAAFAELGYGVSYLQVGLSLNTR